MQLYVCELADSLFAGLQVIHANTVEHIVVWVWILKRSHYICVLQTLNVPCTVFTGKLPHVFYQK